MVRLGRLGLGEGMHMPKSAMTLNEELIQIRQQIKVQEKELRHLKKEYFYLCGICTVIEERCELYFSITKCFWEFRTKDSWTFILDYRNDRTRLTQA